jgi:hypothetical protein
MQGRYDDCVEWPLGYHFHTANDWIDVSGGTEHKRDDSCHSSDLIQVYPQCNDYGGSTTVSSTHLEDQVLSTLQTQPLSVLTQASSIPLCDIGEYVHRSVKVRRKESQQRHCGKVRRPLNAFFLYRKAYYERMLELSFRSGQEISKLCGKSWALEPEVLREQYTKWAEVEKDNHTQAHPGYKFKIRKRVIST